MENAINAFLKQSKTTESPPFSCRVLLLLRNRTLGVCERHSLVHDDRVIVFVMAMAVVEPPLLRMRA